MKKGSITPFLCLMMPLILMVLLVLADYGQFRFHREKWVADQYLLMDHALSNFHEDIFHELALLAVESPQEVSFEDSFDDIDVLEKSILHIMEYRSLLDGVMTAERKANEFLEHVIGVEFELLDVSALNQELYEIVDALSEGEKPEVKIEEFVARVVAMSPYVELKGMSLNALKSHLLKFEFEEIKASRPVFVLRPEISENYSVVLKTLRKYGSFLIDSYMRGDYGVDYVGYSMTKEGSEGLRSEYLVTGLEDQGLKDAYIKAELFSIRLTLNFIETFSNPSIREKLTKVTGGEPRLYAIAALGLSLVEAGMDTSDLLNRKTIPLYKGREGFQSLRAGFKDYEGGWDYPDYLKLMLMLVPRRTYLSRLQHLIEENYEVSASELYTRVRLDSTLEYKGKVIPWKLKGNFTGSLSYLGDQ